MTQLIREGGPPVWLILLFGTICIVTAGLFVRRPDENKLAFLRAMSIVGVFTMIAGFCAGVAKSFGAMGSLPEQMRDQWPFFAMAGISESLADIILGCSFLAFAWFIAAIGIRRAAMG
jgi:hypothetical protein